MDPRQMSMMMKKLGIDVRDIEGVQRVVVHTTSKDYVFDKASVSVMKAQGVETWQVSGKPRIIERSAGGPQASAPSATSQSTTAPSSPPPAETYEPRSDDIALVAKETGKGLAESKAALVATKGDLAEAILRLS
ncbi:MAG: nascent polypeptide-associated complex subunit alpha [Thermoplasmata archaeon]|jgi:nascent polypeptide-associated complex subunit alpha|nr:nascent polypeptide-associated complex subunit alpha [Thermoplasmata archaeon]